MPRDRLTVLRWVFHLLGSLGARRDAVAFSPDVRGARSLAVATVTLAVLLVAQLTLQLGEWPSLGLGLAVFILGLLFLSGAERLQAVGWLVFPFLLSSILPAASWVLAQPLLALPALFYLATHRRVLGFDRALRELERCLGSEWKTYLPLNPQAYHVARALVSPEGQTFLVGITPGRAEERYGTPHVTWRDVTAQTVRDLATHDPGAVASGQRRRYAGERSPCPRGR